MNNQKRRPFRPRPNKNGYRGRSSGPRTNNSHFQTNNGNNNFNRNNGSMTNPFNVEKMIQKYQQLAKDAQSMGDPVLIENYLQHADHFSRRLAELNVRSPERKTLKEEENTTPEISDKTQEQKNVLDSSSLDKK
jgi:hypothetical protein